MLATQNPIESEGTYPLPEAQVDRFLFKLLVDYPSVGEEAAVVGRAIGAPPQVRERLPVEALEHRVLPDDHALDLVQGLLEARTRVLEGGRLPTDVLHQIAGDGRRAP